MKLKKEKFEKSQIGAHPFCDVNIERRRHNARLWLIRINRLIRTGPSFCVETVEGRSESGIGNKKKKWLNRNKKFGKSI